MFAPLGPLMERVIEMDWAFEFAPPGSSLIISDDPCGLDFPAGGEADSFKGWSTPGFSFRVPLTKHLLFTATEGPTGRRWGALTAEQVRAQNERVVQRSHAFIISSRSGFDGDEVLSELHDGERESKGWTRDVVFPQAVREHIRTLARKVRARHNP